MDITEIKAMVRTFPEQSGVYIMKDDEGTIIYVGKAKVLRNRVRSYFSGDKDPKTRLLVSRIDTIDYIVTSNEYEALLLENSLIKKWKPKYNINLKDGKTYPVIRVTNEPFPRVYRTRRVIQDGSAYFGPFTQIGSIDLYLQLIEKIFPLRKCKGQLKKRKQPCLYYHIGRCKAPCCGKISREEYAKTIHDVKELLSGNTAKLRKRLEKEMMAASKIMAFEKAADIRDTIRALDTLESDQTVVDFDPESRDYIGMAIEGALVSFAVLQMRGGKLQGHELFRAESYSQEEDSLSEFLIHYYERYKTLPAQIFLPKEMDTGALTDYFRKERKAEIAFLPPGEGKVYSLLRMALENARIDLDKRLRDRVHLPALEALVTLLGLSRLPRRIEGFDIAQLHGKFAVASMVSFKNGFPDKPEYRRYHIKSLEGKIDDFGAIREVIARRYTRLKNENLPLPDLILVDGGKGQVSSAMSILSALELDHIPVIGLAKKFEEIVIPHQPDAIRLPEGDSALRILQHVRDEAHRFATGLNKRLREKDLSFSLLEGFPGIGPKRSTQLMETYVSIETILATDSSEISRTTGIPEDVVAGLQKYLQDRDSGSVL